MALGGCHQHPGERTCLMKQLPARSLAIKARLVLTQVLRGQEFKARNPAWYERWLRAVLRLIAIVVEFIIKHTALRLSVGVVALAIVFAGFLYVLRIVNQSHVDEVALPSKREEHDKIGARELRRQAEEAAGISDYRRALRLLYLSFLADLRARGMLSDRTDLTNWEYVSQLRERDARLLIDKAEALTTVFERKWYGHRPVSRDDYERFSMECKI